MLVYAAYGLLVLVFIGFPFVVRTLQPVLEALDAEAEEAASLLGASRWQTFRRVTIPEVVVYVDQMTPLDVRMEVGERITGAQVVTIERHASLAESARRAPTSAKSRPSK